MKTPHVIMADCGGCMCFRFIGSKNAQGERLGECRAEPPRFNPRQGRDGVWPKITSAAWCAAFIQRPAGDGS